MVFELRKNAGVWLVIFQTKTKDFETITNKVS